MGWRGIVVGIRIPDLSSNSEAGDPDFQQPSLFPAIWVGATLLFLAILYLIQSFPLLSFILG